MFLTEGQQPFPGVELERFPARIDWCSLCGVVFCIDADSPSLRPELRDEVADSVLTALAPSSAVAVPADRDEVLEALAEGKPWVEAMAGVRERDRAAAAYLAAREDLRACLELLNLIRAMPELQGEKDKKDHPLILHARRRYELAALEYVEAEKAFSAANARKAKGEGGTDRA